MQKIINYISKNLLQIIITIFFIIFIYSLIHSGNKAYKEKEKNVISDNKNDGYNVTDAQCKRIITNFLDACTDGNYELAYKYLSEECKKEKYSSLEIFINSYCLSNSIKGKDFVIAKVANETKPKYKIELNNMLSSGKVNSDKIINYYTIVVEDENNIKISIER